MNAATAPGGMACQSHTASRSHGPDPVQGEDSAAPVPSVEELIGDIQAHLQKAHSPEANDVYVAARNMAELSRAVVRLSAHGPGPVLDAAFGGAASTVALLLTRLQAAMLAEIGLRDRQAIRSAGDSAMLLPPRIREAMADLDLLTSMLSRISEAHARHERLKAMGRSDHEPRTGARRPRRPAVRADSPEDGGGPTFAPPRGLRLRKAEGTAN